MRLKGVVTWHPEGAFYALVVDDGKEGIYCDVRMAMERGLLPERYHVDVLAKTVNEGVEVEIEGVTDRGGYAPIVLPTAIRAIGSADLPAPKTVPFLNLFSGAMDCQRVVVEGVVRAAHREKSTRAVTLDVGTFYGSFQFRLLEPNDLAAATLVNAKVRVAGCLLPLFNARTEMIGVTVQTNRLSDLMVLEAGPEDPFAAQEIVSTGLRPFSAAGVELHRQKVRGVVTAQRPGGYLMLQRGTKGIQAFSETDDLFEVGDLVEAVGFVNFRTAVGCLENALFRKVGKAEVSESRPVTIERLLQPRGYWGNVGQTEDLNGMLVSVDGLVAGIEDRSGETRVTVESGGRFIPAAVVQQNGAAVFPDLGVGATVRVTGVVSLSYKAGVPTGNELKPSGAFLVMRTAGDLEVLRAAPWWTLERVQTAQVLVPLFLLVAVVWIFALQRLVSTQGAKLQEALLAYRDVERENEACQKERMRLAADLHDGFQQVLAGAMYRLDAAMTCAKEMPEALQRQLGGADAALKQAQKGLRDALWGLTEGADGSATFVNLIQHAAQKMDHWQGLVTVSQIGEERPVPPAVMGHLLMLFQESVGNAISHGKAKRVDVEVRYFNQGVAIEIADDGLGFDPKAADAQANGTHFGLKGMRRRMKEVGGNLTIESEPGRGARVTAYVGLRKVLAGQKSPKRGMEEAGMKP